MEITYDYYRIFYYVAKYGSISQAATALFRGQPNVSKTIQTLESQLGCVLLTRSTKGVSLTPEGKKLYEHLQVAFEHISSAENEIISARNLDSGSISIATTEVALYGSVIEAMSAFCLDYPKVKIKLTNSNNSTVLSMLRNGLADFAIITGSEITDRNFRIKPIKKFREMFCIKGGSESFDISSFHNYTYIGTDANTYSYRLFNEYFKSIGIDRKPDVEVSTFNQVLQLVKAGIGVGFISQPIASEWLKNGQIKEIPLPVAPPLKEICLVEDKNRTLNVAAKTFATYLR